MDISIAYCGHGREGPVQTVDVLRGSVSLIYANQYEPAFLVGQLTFTHDIEETGDPVSDKGNEDYELEELDDDVHGLRRNVLLEPDKDAMESQDSQQSENPDESHDLQEPEELGCPEH
jgi:hypothetical protein